ncbi:MAG TPA: hypothetical protein VFA96_04545 [Nocardioides sp.]|nr:hypothetical protein [Nocardioides sp.]
MQHEVDGVVHDLRVAAPVVVVPGGELGDGRTQDLAGQARVDGPEVASVD